MDDFAYRIEYVVKLYLTSMFLYNLIIAPIEMIVDWVFTFFYTKLHMLGAIGAIYGVSIVINFLALPLYNIADALQEKERVISKKLEYRVKRIKKAFKGDEQFMMLSEYYRQNNYHPLYTLRSSLSILIEIPFFIAAYHYLSHATYLENAAVFTWISDLSAPDRLFSFYIGSRLIKINILPIVMTLINFISGYIYTRNSTLRDKIQLYAMGIFFLVILYDSPSGLVIYWICNNIFSLVKTIILKTKHPNRNGRIIVCIFLLGLVVFLFNIRKKYSYVLLVLALVILLYPLLRKQIEKTKEDKPIIEIRGGGIEGFLPVLLVSGIGLALLCGLLLPSSAIATSPIEFSFIGNTEKPSAYVWRSLIVFSGLFVFWPFCIYKMFGTKVKKWETILLLIAFIGALTNAFVFKSNYGTIDTQFFLSDSVDLSQVSVFNIAGPIIVLLLILAIFHLLKRFGKISYIAFAILSLCIAECVIGGMKLASINNTFEEYKKNLEANGSLMHNESKNDGNIESVFHLSKSKKNVVILFLDRATGTFFPYALEQLSELKEQFKGFVYYPNTVSFSSNTSAAFPPMIAGYEYTQEKMNARSSELLVDKHNEASLMLPTLFAEAGYDITISDSPLPNYSWSGDLSAFNSLDNAKVVELNGSYRNRYMNDASIVLGDLDNITYREARNFSLLQVLPPVLRNSFNESFRTKNTIMSFEADAFINNFSTLYYLRELTAFDSFDNQYVFFGNDTTHSPIYLDSGFLKPAAKGTGAILRYSTSDDSVAMHFSTFVASLKQVGLWLDYLRDNGVYDNTRIIVVSDHGARSNLAEGFERAGFEPLLLFKDFNSNDDIVYDSTFMTNADTNFLARQNLGISGINPFTGNELKVDKADGVNVYPIYETEYNPTVIKGYSQFTLVTNGSFHVVPGDILNKDNWIPLSEWNSQNGGNR